MMRWTADRLQNVTRGRWLSPAGRDARIDGVGIDSREVLTGRAFIAIHGDRFDGHDFVTQAARAGAVAIVVEREVDPPDGVAVLLVDSTRGALADMARVHRDELDSATVIAITGSAGKTTTKAFVNAVLGRAKRGVCARRSFNNEIGVPLTILSAPLDSEYVVVEVGTNAPGEIEMLGRIVRPEIGVITSIGRAHLAGLKSLAGVTAEKGALLRCVRSGGTCLIPAAWETELRPFAEGRRTMTAGRRMNADYSLRARLRAGGKNLFVLGDGREFSLAVPGVHHAENALFAIAAGDLMGVDSQTIRDGLAAADLPDMRMTRHDIDGVSFLNDAYNANPESMAASLGVFIEGGTRGARRVAILGDMLELGPASTVLHEELGAFVGRLMESGDLDRAYVVGAFAGDVAAGAHGTCAAPDIETFSESTAAALQHIVRELEPGDDVLLKGSRGMQLERVLEIAASVLPNSRKRRLA